MDATEKKIFFYYSGKLHNAYRHMVANPPEGFVYTTGEEMAYAAGTAANNGVSLPGKIAKFLQPSLTRYYNRFLIEAAKPKTRSFDAMDYALVHSGQSILATNRPYVMDFEHAAVFAGYNQYAFRKPAFVRALKRRLLNKNLKCLTPWSEAAKKSLLNFVPDETLTAKTETVYPVVTPPEKLERIKHDSVNFLFVGTAFYEKGGYDALLAFSQLAEEYDATLTIISNIPPEIASKHGTDPKIKLLPLQPYHVVQKLYQNSDVFVFPTHYDTFGFVIPEAMSYGLPVLSVDSFSTPELVGHERTGLIVKSFYSCYEADYGYADPTLEALTRQRNERCRNPTPTYIAEMADAMELLINDGSLRSKLSAAARKETLEGKFSPKVWKEKMGRIYRQATE